MPLSSELRGLQLTVNSYQAEGRRVRFPQHLLNQRGVRKKGTLASGALVQESMAEHVICKGDIEVSVGGRGDRTLIFVKDDVALRFWAETSEIERALNGEAVHIDVHGGSCDIEVDGESGEVRFLPDYGTHYSCNFRRSDLASALVAVRHSPEEA